MSHEEFLRQLPPECQSLSIEPRKKMALQPFFLPQGVIVVLIDDRPGSKDMAWKVDWQRWKEMNPKHGTRVRYIREHLKPDIESQIHLPRKEPEELCLQL